MVKKDTPEPRSPCKKCGEIHAKCTAHNRKGKPCARPPVDGSHVCFMHGGAAPRTIAAAERVVRTREIESEIGAVLAHEGVAPIDDPLDELSRLASAAQAMCDALGARVNALADVTTMDDNGHETICAEIILYEHALDRTAKFLEILVRAGFMERQVKIQEDTADAVVNVLQRILSRLELTPHQLDQVPIIVPEELRALEM